MQNLRAAKIPNFSPIITEFSGGLQCVRARLQTDVRREVRSQVGRGSHGRFCSAVIAKGGLSRMVTCKYDRLQLFTEFCSSVLAQLLKTLFNKTFVHFCMFVSTDC